MRTIWGKKGHSSTLPCSVDLPDDKNYSLEWRKDGKLIVNAYGDEAGHASPSYQGRIARDGSLGLTIHSIDSEDSGTYNCVLTKFQKQPTRAEHGSAVRLFVNVGPEILSPKNGFVEFVKEKDSLTITCKVNGAPPPEVTWTKNERIVSSSSTLHIQNITTSDQGHYKCLAVNVEGKAESSIELKFSKSTSFDFVPTNKTVVVGSNVFWHCHASAQPERIHYSWTFQDRPIKKTPTGLRADMENGDLSLKEVRRTDRGWYRCEATNSKGDLSQVSAFLDVQYTPEAQPNHRQMMTIGINQNGTVECEVDANPPASRFTWTKNGHFLTTSQLGSYRITNAKETDGGIYRCLPSNSIGPGEALETHVVVSEPPVFSIRPPPEIRIREGSKLEVPCEGFGDPLPIVYWIRNQSRISSSALSFSPIKHADHGKYDCVVSNAVSTITTSTNILVEKSRPQPASIYKVSCVGEDSLEVFWKPGFDGSHEQTFVVHYHGDLEGAPRRISTVKNAVILENLTPYAVYNISIESRNSRGSSFSSKVRKAMCSPIPPPSEIALDGSTIKWSTVDVARSYRVEARSTTQHAYQQIGEVVHPYYHFNEAGLNKAMEVRVRSLRPFFDASVPSHTIKLGTPIETSDISIAWALCGGLVFFMCFLLVWLCCRRPSCETMKKKNNRRSHDYVCPVRGSSQPQTETFYEPSINLMEDGDYGEWSGPRDNPLRLRYPEEMVEVDYDLTEDQSAVEDMLRNRYIYGAEDVPAQLITDLRIERLRREYKQSQL